MVETTDTGSDRFESVSLDSTLAFSPRMVELVGIEPATSWLQTRRSPS
jgi:hypothetical protein